MLRHDGVCKGGDRAPAQLELGQHEFRSAGVCRGVVWNMVWNKWTGVRAHFDCCLEVENILSIFSSEAGGKSELKQR